MNVLVVLALALNCALCLPDQLQPQTAVLPRNFHLSPDQFGKMPKIHVNLVKFLTNIKDDIIKFNKVLNEGTDQVHLRQLSNKFMDKVIQELQKTFKYDLNPFPLPDIWSNYKFDLLGEKDGQLHLANGTLRNLHTVQRRGNVHIRKKAKGVKVTLPLVFHKVPYHFDYDTKTMGMVVNGTVEGTVWNFRADVIITGNPKQGTVDKAQFKIKKIEKIAYHFSGNGIVDLVLNTMTQVFGDMVTQTVKRVVDSVIKQQMEEFVRDVQKVLDKK